MLPLATVVLIASWTAVAEGRNDTIVHGWVSEPDGRGTWSILWSCLFTIFICTWSVLHLDVPKRHGRWYLFFRKVGYMLVTAIAPEVMVIRSFARYLNARQLLRQLVTRGREGWTMTHAQFAMAGGIRFQDVNGAMVPNRKASLIKAVKSGKVHEPSISEKELSSRSKSDWVLKLVAICQITWFALQALFRGVKHLQVTALEILTVAFVFCSIFIYAFCWNQPQGVEFPIIIRMDEDNADLSQTFEPSDYRFAVGQELHCDQQETTDLDTAPNDVSQGRRSWPTSRHGSAVDGASREGFVKQLAPIADHSNSRSARWNDGDIPSAYESGLMLQSESRSSTPLQNMDVSEAGDVGHPDSDPNTIARPECIANAGENHERNPYQDRPQASSSKILGERNPKSSTTVVPEATVLKIDGGVSDLEGIKKPSNSESDAQSDQSDNMTFSILGLLGSLFGAIHCLAWNSPFPTSQERFAWRVCSVAATCLPLSVAPLPLLWVQTDHMEFGSILLIFVVTPSYAVARITLIVLAFIALRALPADAYQTVNWNSYIPHSGA